MPLISRSEVVNRTRLSTTTLWRKERAGDFPRAVQISKNRVAYDSDQVDAWIQFVISATSQDDVDSA